MTEGLNRYNVCWRLTLSQYILKNEKTTPVSMQENVIKKIKIETLEEYNDTT